MALDPLDALPITSTPAPSPAPNRVLLTILGIILLIPTLLCWLTTLLLPSLQTLLYSQQKINLLSPQTQNVGMANFTTLFSDPVFNSAAIFSATLAIERLVVVAVVPLLLALALNEFGRIVRVPARLLFSIPLALFAPALALISWRLAFNPINGLFATSVPVLASPVTVRSTLLMIDALQTFGLACGLGLIVYLVALRGTGSSAPTWRRIRVPLFVVWLVSVFAAIAYAIQSFDLAFVLTQGGPGSSTMTLTMYQYRVAFQTFNFGMASAVATLKLIGLGILGLFAGAVMIAVGLRLETVPWGKPAGLLRRQDKTIVAALLALGIAVALAICAYAALPMFWTWITGLQTDPATMSSLSETVQPSRTLSNTILPAVVAILIVQLPVTYLGALSIGALRPLGKRSEWLLLLFSPWLFTSIEPLSIALFQNIRNAKALDTLGGVGFAPAILNVVMLFILTFYFKGQTRKWQGMKMNTFDSFIRVVILPSLPLALFLAGIGIVTAMQDLFWPLVVTNSADFRTIPVAVVIFSSQFATRIPPLAALIAYFGVQLFLITFVVLAVFQVFYLDRLALGAGNDEDQDAAETVPEVSPPAEDSELLDSLLG